MDNLFPTFRRILGTKVPLPSLWPWPTTLAQRQSLLRLIAVAAEEKLPLSELVESWAMDERGGQHRRLLQLADLLKGGTSLPDAIEQVPGVLHDDDILAIRFGSQSGTLAAAVRQQINNRRLVGSGLSEVRKTASYGYAIVALGLPILAFYQIRIIPQLNAISQEFQLPKPPVLEWSSAIADFFAAYWWLVAIFILAFLLLASCAPPGRRIRRAVLGRFFRPLRELRAADILSKLSLTLQVGRPVPGALSTLARYHFDPAMRHRLLFVRNEVEHGADVWQSMANVGLLTPPDVRVMDTSERVGNQPWALKQLALAKQRRIMRRLENASAFVLPAMILVLGGVVLFEALTIFLPLVQIIRGLV